MREFWLNGEKWRMVRVGPASPALVDRTGRLALATTEPQSRLICVSNAIDGDALERVVVHEVAHAALVSFGLLENVGRFAKPHSTVDAEEFVCGFVSECGGAILSAAYEITRPL